MIVTIIVEQPAGEKFRMKYIPEQKIFVATEYISLSYDRGFKGIYGWVDGYGQPPDPHQDVFLITNNAYGLGQAVEGKIIGCFLRNDGDNKLVCIEPDRPEEDMGQLPEAEIRMLKAQYPRIDENEGWYGRKRAIALLGKSDR